MKVTPYISNEIWYSLKADKATMNWMTIGCNKKINKHLIIGPFYRLAGSKTKGSWRNTHYLGFKTIVSF